MTTTDDQADRHPTTGETLEAWVTRNRTRSLTALAVAFRQRVGRPMSGQEWAIAELAHSAGWHDGLDAALASSQEAAP